MTPEQRAVKLAHANAQLRRIVLFSLERERTEPVSDTNNEMTIVRRDVRLRIVNTPAAAQGGYGFAKQTDRPEEEEHVFVHATSLSSGGQSANVNNGDELIADICQTRKGLRALNVRRA